MDIFDDDFIFERKKASRRRRLNRNLQDGVDEISTVEDLMIKRHGKRSKSYIPENGVRVQKLLRKISSKNSVETTGTGDNEEPRHIPHPIQAKRSEKPSGGGEDSSMKSQEHSPLSVTEKSPRFQHSAVVNRVKKTMSNSETIRDNDSNKSIVLSQEDQQMLSTSTPKIHIVKLPRNKVSAYPKTRSMTTTDSTISQRRNPSGINNDIFGEVSLPRIDAKVSVRNDNPSRREKLPSSRRRASSFNGVDVCRVKPTNDHDKVWINHPRSAIFTKNHNMDVDNRVTVVSVMKP